MTDKQWTPSDIHEDSNARSDFELGVSEQSAQLCFMLRLSHIIISRSNNSALRAAPSGAKASFGPIPGPVRGPGCCLCSPMNSLRFCASAAAWLGARRARRCNAPRYLREGFPIKCVVERIVSGVEQLLRCTGKAHVHTSLLQSNSRLCKSCCRE